MSQQEDRDRVSDVIQFGYEDFKIDQAKQLTTAKCRNCRVRISEKLGTTSGYVRHLKTAAQPTLRNQRVKLVKS